MSGDLHETLVLAEEAMSLHARAEEMLGKGQDAGDQKVIRRLRDAIGAGAGRVPTGPAYVDVVEANKSRIVRHRLKGELRGRYVDDGPWLVRVEAADLDASVAAGTPSDDADELRVPLAAYRAACDNPEVIDVAATADILADSVEAFLASARAATSRPLCRTPGGSCSPMTEDCHNCWFPHADGETGA